MQFQIGCSIGWGFMMSLFSASKRHHKLSCRNNRTEGRCTRSWQWLPNLVISQVPLARMSHEKARSDPMGSDSFQGPQRRTTSGDQHDAAIDFIYHDMQHARLWFSKYSTEPSRRQMLRSTCESIFLEQALPICPQCQVLCSREMIRSIDFLRTPGLRRSDAVPGNVP